MKLSTHAFFRGLMHTFCFSLLLTLSLKAEDPKWLAFKGQSGPGSGKKIVLISGDEEYRSEETCPMLAKILSQRHGFDCTVLFSIDPEKGFIDPNNQQSLPGLEALESADLMIIGTRFRQLSDADYAHLARYLNRGGPVIGFRTATHAFRGSGQSGAFKWSQFGLKILGETWISHHGRHKGQGTRAIVSDVHADHPVLNGVGEIFGPTDVYGIRNLDPEQATVVLLGGVTESLEEQSPLVAGDKNDPMMPLAWFRTYSSPDQGAEGQAFCTTLGASVDMLDADLRRLFVNASYHLVGLEVPRRAAVEWVDPFSPTFYGFNNDETYYERRNLRVSDFELGRSASTGLARPQSVPKGWRPTSPF